MTCENCSHLREKLNETLIVLEQKEALLKNLEDQFEMKHKAHQKNLIANAKMRKLLIDNNIDNEN